MAGLFHKFEAWRRRTCTVILIPKSTDLISFFSFFEFMGGDFISRLLPQ
jgi:hypothetical protein